MQAILKPISHPDLGDLVIDDALVNVGRGEDFFAALPAARTARLSRRHARLFDQGGTLYIVDLSSRNGTFVNGEPIDVQPRALQSGDLIDFAGELTYRLDFAGNGGRRAVAAPGPVTLQLVATLGENGPDSLVVSAFPFLISKQAEAFAKYQVAAPDELNYLSRRHAHIFNKSGRLLIEDLGSTNGTFVDSQRLADQPLELHDGQTVAFGGDYFVYRVVLGGGDDATRVLAPAAAASGVAGAGDKTTFVTAATSFLEIFCADDEVDDEPESTPESKSPAESTTRPRSLPAQLIEVFGGSPQRVAVLLVTLLVVAVGLVYWAAAPSDSDRLQALIEQGRFDDALALARSDAAVGQSGSLVSRLALRALVAKTLPDWLEALEGERFDELAAMRSASSTSADGFPAGREYLDLLAQIGEIRATLAARGGPSTPLRWFDEEPATFERLITAWQRPQPDKRQISERVLAAIAADQAALAARFRDAYRTTASQVRALASRLDVYRPAQQQMAQLLRSQLAAGTLDRLGVELDQLAQRYSQFHGVERLRDDLANYRSIAEALAAQRELDAARRFAEIRFHAAPFADAAARLARDRLPSGDFLAAYDAGAVLWQRGQADAARTRLGALQDTPWRALVERELAHMQQVSADFDALQALRGSDAYTDHLLTFVQGLDAQRDVYFAQQLAADYAVARQQSAQRAEQAALAADEAWTAYGGRSGITSTQRLDPRVDKGYAQRAAALSTAATTADRAARAYALADVVIPHKWRTLLDAIDQEVALQHQSLDELQGVLEDTVLRDKRALLPERKR